MHSRWGIRRWYEAQILHESSAVITVKWWWWYQGQRWRHSTPSTEPRAEKMCLAGCCVNESDWMWVLGVWKSICWRLGHWLYLHITSEVLCWTCKPLHNNVLLSTFTPQSCPTRVFEALWPPIFKHCVSTVSELAIYQHLFSHRNPRLPPRIITVSYYWPLISSTGSAGRLSAISWGWRRQHSFICGHHRPSIFPFPNLPNQRKSSLTRALHHVK